MFSNILIVTLLYFVLSWNLVLGSTPDKIDNDPILHSVKDYCKKNGVQNFDVKQLFTNYTSCYQKTIDMSSLQTEINAASRTGTLDEVFSKYCSKFKSVNKCFDEAVDSFALCVPDTLKVNIPVIKKAAEHFVSFLCFENGERIALFIAESGLQCIQSQSPSLLMCIEPLRQFHSVEELINLPKAEQCKQIMDLNKCVVNALENCETTTPSNMVDALINYVMRESEICAGRQ